MEEAVTTGRRDDASSLGPDPVWIAWVVRSRGAIDSMHWTLDVGLQ